MGRTIVQVTVHKKLLSSVVNPENLGSIMYQGLLSPTTTPNICEKPKTHHIPAHLLPEFPSTRHTFYYTPSVFYSSCTFTHAISARRGRVAGRTDSRRTLGDPDIGALGR